MDENFTARFLDDNWDIRVNNEYEFYARKTFQHIESFGPPKDKVFKVWEKRPGYFEITRYIGFIRNKEEWQIVKELIQI